MTDRSLRRRGAAAFITLVLGISSAGCLAAQPADLVVMDAKIYTENPGHEVAQALAVRDGRIVYVGDAAGAAALVGAATHTERLHGALVLPGLVDAHIHPLDIGDYDVCDLKVRAVTLRELSDLVHGCIVRYHPAPGAWLKVHQWNSAEGNQPDAELPTLRAALDRASREVRIELLGDDGHHNAYNSAALALAKDRGDRVVGLTRATLAGELHEYAPLVGVDERGEPNGAVNEDARFRISRNAMLYNDLEDALKSPERIVQKLNSVGITAMLDAMASPEGLPVYDKLLAAHALTVRATLAQFYDPERFRGAGGRIDWDTMVARASEVRARYADNPLVTADTVKLFADGVLEGNPFAVPPTLPDAASSKPFLQPIFGVDDHGLPSVTGYVDTASPLCAQTRAHPVADVAAFRKQHGFHPAQCVISSGQLQHERAVLLEFVRRFHVAGFNLHIHAIGDLAVHTALDALEMAYGAGAAGTRDALAHLQLVDDADIARIGRDHLYAVFTYSWATVDAGYDLTVIPFLQPVHGNSYAALHPPGSWYETHVYPTRSVQRAGGLLAAGSDAPVATRDPQPFVNIAIGITRRVPGQQSLNAAQALTLPEMLDAYTITGARMLGRDGDIGSLEVGKSADFIVLDQDILALPAAGRADHIADTHVLATWFMGKQVYARATTGKH